jgi:hypothetical protein
MEKHQIKLFFSVLVADLLFLGQSDVAVCSDKFTK